MLVSRNMVDQICARFVADGYPMAVVADKAAKIDRKEIDRLITEAIEVTRMVDERALQYELARYEKELQDALADVKPVTEAPVAPQVAPTKPAASAPPVSPTKPSKRS